MHDVEDDMLLNVFCICYCYILYANDLICILDFDLFKYIYKIYTYANINTKIFCAYIHTYVCVYVCIYMKI